MSYAAAIAAAAATTPMSNGSVPIVQGRLLAIDADGLAYYCAGNDETDPGEARQRLIQKVEGAHRACGASDVKLFATARGSHKGYRYAVARAKAYQGQRAGSRRPKNWEYLRSLIDEGKVGGYDVEMTGIAEADDLFSRYSAAGIDIVINTQDKDMRMVPGLHLDWLTNLMFRLEPTTFAVMHNDKLYGRKWFWTQVLMGDPADNIPGLPFYVPKGTTKAKRVGEVTATQALANLSSDGQCCIHVGAMYESYYNERWLVELLEQGILLWMRTDASSDPFNVCAAGNPLAPLTTHALWPAAQAEIMARIKEAQAYAAIEDDGSRTDTPVPTGEPAQPVCPVQPATDPGTGSAGSRPLLGGGEGDAAQRVQCPVGEGGERVDAIRRPQPVGLPAWMRHILAKA